MFYRDRRGEVSLHFVWDTPLVRDMIGKRKIAQVAESLLKRNFLNQKEWPKGTPEEWANEAHVVARNWVYLGIKEDGPPPRLEQAYILQATSATEAQIKRGRLGLKIQGVRLAAVLNGCFDPSR